MTNFARLTSRIAGPFFLAGSISAATKISDTSLLDRRRLHPSDKRHSRSLPLGALMIFRRLTVLIMLAVTAAGCTHYGVSGPEDLGLAARFDPQKLPTTLTPGDPNPKLSRNELLNQWIVRSDFLCSDYLLVLSRSIRDTRLATDFTATVLAGLATIFAQPAVTRPLAGAATIALGVGADIQSDLFLQQAGDVVSTAIQAVRTRARTELQKKQIAEYEDYTIGQGLADVQRYASETCNLNVGLNEIRASLNIAGRAPLANDPIIPLAPQGAETGAASSPGTATSGTTGPVATTIIPPNVQQTPGGGLVITPGKVVNTPVTGGAATTGATTPPPVGPGSTSRPGTGLGSTSGATSPSGRRAVSAGEPLPLIVQRNPDAFILGGRNQVERELLLPLGKHIQSVLCLSLEQQTGNFGDQTTRDAIKSYRSAKGPNPSEDPLSRREKDELLLANECAPQYKSAYERFAFPTEEQIKRLQRSLGNALSKAVPPITVDNFEVNGELGPPTRKAIEALQRLKGLSETGIMTRQLRDMMAV